MKLVYMRDLKSLGHCGRAGSTPAPSTNSQVAELYNSWAIKDAGNGR